MTGRAVCQSVKVEEDIVAVAAEVEEGVLVVVVGIVARIVQLSHSCICEKSNLNVFILK
jgi:hypothetical protein